MLRALDYEQEHWNWGRICWSLKPGLFASMARDQGQKWLVARLHMLFGLRRFLFLNTY